MSMKWFKLHSEIKDDLKILAMRREQRWTWICLLCLASESKARGKIEAVNRLVLSASLRISEAELDAELALFKSLGLITITADPLVITIVKWEDRQYEKPSDSPEANSERQRRFRARNANVTPCNANVTRYGGVSNALCNATDTDTDTERDTESFQSSSKIEKKKKEFSDSFHLFWDNTKYPRRPGDTQQAVYGQWVSCIIAGLKPEQIIAAARMYADKHNGDKFAVGLRKFMNPETIRQTLATGGGDKPMTRQQIETDLRIWKGNLEYQKGEGNGSAEKIKDITEIVSNLEAMLI